MTLLKIKNKRLSTKKVKNIIQDFDDISFFGLTRAGLKCQYTCVGVCILISTCICTSGDLQK